MDDAIGNATFATKQIDEDLLHDLRNRLTAIKGVAQLLERQVRRDDWQREKILTRLDRLASEITELEQLIDGFEHSGPRDAETDHAPLH